MKNVKIAALFLFVLGIVAVIGLSCSPQKAEMVRPVAIADNDYEPADWGKAFPVNYELWKKTGDPYPPGMSKYKHAYETDRIVYDRLSEFPYSALLFNGWGMGSEYNEPRGHFLMLSDQLQVDPARVKAGGVCLSCKTPYAPKMVKEMGKDYYSKPYKEVQAMIPEKHRKLGVACIDCHDNKDMSLRISREFTLGKALKDMGVDATKLSRQEMRTVICAQCHVTYSIPKDADMHSTGLFFPWQGSTFGNISVENVIKKLRSDPSFGEWKQSVTGFKLAFIRHPEFELFSNNSVHWKAGAACADCHMPYTRVGSAKVSDHRITSPLRNDMKACMQCHTESVEWLRSQVTAIQDRTVSLTLRAGYATATVAKLFEKVHGVQASGGTVDPALYDKAKDYYEEAFYRLVFIGAENSVGFHNPTEAQRNLADAVAFAGKAEGLLRQALAKAGVDTPARIDLELGKYLNGRGEKKLSFQKQQEIRDPYGTQDRMQ